MAKKTWTWKDGGYESPKDYKRQIRTNVRDLNRDIVTLNKTYGTKEKKVTIKQYEKMARPLAKNMKNRRKKPVKRGIDWSKK